MEGVQKRSALSLQSFWNSKTIRETKMYLNVNKKLYWDIIHMPFTVQNLMIWFFCVFCFLLSIHRYVHPSPRPSLGYCYHPPKETVYHFAIALQPSPWQPLLDFLSLCRFFHSGHCT